MTEITFVDELPPSEGGGGFTEFWLELEQNPGVWAIYPGAVKAVRTAAGHKSRNGVVFEGRQRGNVGYVRCVPRDTQ